MQTNNTWHKYLKVGLKLAALLLFLYLFLLSIEMMGAAMKGMGKGFAEELLSTTANPFISLVIGIFATSLVQSSSTSTSIIVGLVASGGLSITGAIPMIMGANIGTSVTNTIVSLGHISRPAEFKRAFAAGTIHDFFNLAAVAILLPIELLLHPIEKLAVFLSGIFTGVGGITLLSPIKLLTKPVAVYLKGTMSPIILLALAVILISLSLYFLVKLMKSIMAGRIEIAIDRYIFKKASIAFVFGIIFTVLVQSSSVTTSLIVPLVGAGLLTIKKIYPFILGANIGTTITAMLAALITANPAAITVAIAHLLFNVLGIIIIYPAFKDLPIRLANKMGEIAVKSKKFAVLYIVGVFYLIPLLLIFLFK